MNLCMKSGNLQYIMKNNVISSEGYRMESVTKKSQYNELKGRSGNMAVVLQFPKTERKQAADIDKDIRCILGHELQNQMRQN